MFFNHHSAVTPAIFFCKIKDYNANQGSCSGSGTNDFTKEDCQSNRGMMIKEHIRPGGLHGRHENGLPNKGKIENSDNWEKDTSKNHLTSTMKGEDYS
jgi:hypothetical protein